MKVVMAAIVGITAAYSGFGAGLLGTILVGPWTGSLCPAVTAGYVMGTIAMLASFAAALSGRGRESIGYRRSPAFARSGNSR